MIHDPANVVILMNTVVFFLWGVTVAVNVFFFLLKFLLIHLNKKKIHTKPLRRRNSEIFDEQIKCNTHKKKYNSMQSKINSMKQSLKAVIVDFGSAIKRKLHCHNVINEI